MKLRLTTVLFFLVSTNVFSVSELTQIKNRPLVAQAEAPPYQFVKPGMPNVIPITAPKASKVTSQELLETAEKSIEDGDLEGLTLALDKGLSPDARFKDGNPIILWVCFLGDLKMLKVLISKGANLNIKGVNGLTPLMTAVKGFKYSIVEYLVNNGADKRIKNNFNWTALDFARQSRDEVLILMTKF
jgi:ankyrin repeat protein